MNRRRGWRWIIGAGATVAALTVLTPDVARAATVAQQHGRAVQQVTPQALQARPAPEARNWGRERDEPRDRDWRDGHRGDEGRYAWRRPYYWGAPAEGWYEPVPPAPPAPVYVPGQWLWTGYAWVLQPGYWTY
jgi:hypothetical protein